MPKSQFKNDRQFQGKVVKLPHIVNRAGVARVSIGLQLGYEHLRIALPLYTHPSLSPMPHGLAPCIVKRSSSLSQANLKLAPRPPYVHMYTLKSYSRIRLHDNNSAGNDLADALANQVANERLSR
jgi:hypothetical protein